MPIEQIRNVLLIALVMVLFLLWQEWQQAYGPKPVPTSGPSTEASSSAVPAPPQPGTADAPASASADDAVSRAADVPVASGAAAEPSLQATAQGRIRVTTDVLEALINPRGGAIEQLRLLHYPESAKIRDQPFALLKNSRSDLFLVQTGLVGAQDAPTHRTEFTSARAEYALEDGDDALVVPLAWTSPQGVKVTRRYRFKRNSYVVELEHQIRNESAEPWSAQMYGQFQRTQVVPEGGLFRTYTYTGGVISYADNPYKKIDFDDMASQDLSATHKGGWVAMIQHYFTAALVPGIESSNFYYSKALDNGRYVLGVMTPPIQIDAGGVETLSLELYAGPKDEARLEAVAPYLGRTRDYGWLWFIAEPLFWGLRWIHGFIGNWGFAIIILTVVIKLLFFQLSAASYKSMARMRKLQPRIMQLRDRYSGDKARLNQAMMELYKTEKINPLGGCLPILVQIPVFIALYWVLLESVELRQAPFVLWLDDLSEYDPYFVLPLLMGASMFVQQKLNPAPPDPVQAKVMMALPIVFTFLFLFFPSGLVLYWFVNNLLSIAQQWVITRKIVGPDG